MDIIEVSNVSKIYKLYNKPSDRLKETFSVLKKKYHKEYYALKDISFRIEKGETVGIIGGNGAGKSTLLKIITGVLNQTYGEVSIKGRVAALLELGAGFNMDYTGLENIYMNGLILGYTEDEIEEKIDDILEFADIGDFIRQPVKTYSSGMLVRLAFALSINIEPEILIIDEALAVGDAFFQAKCFSKLEQIKAAGTTILFVSHDIASVKKLCNKVIWLENGRIKQVGNPMDICEKYLCEQIKEQNIQNEKLSQKAILQNYTNDIEVNKETKIFNKLIYNKISQVSGNGKANILSLYIRGETGSDDKILIQGEEYELGVVVKFEDDVKNVLFGFEVESVKGVKILSVNNYLTNNVVKSVCKNEIYEAIFRFKLPKICSGEYLVSVSVAAGTQSSHVVLQRLHNIRKIIIDSQGYNLSLIEIDNDTMIKKYNEHEITIL